MKRKRLLIGLLVCGGVCLALDQVAQYTVLADGLVSGHLVAPFDPPLFSPRQRDFTEGLGVKLAEGSGADRFHRAFDAELGWCPVPGSGGKKLGYDWSGGRMGFVPLAREKGPGIRRVVAVGCSFTRGEEVMNEEAWPALLDRDLEQAEVVNLGVGGYGLDQAFLRWRRDGVPLDADEVWLGWLPLASLRLTSVYMPAMSHWYASPAFKPKYLIAPDGSLELRPCPVQTLPELYEALTDQDAFLEAVGHADPWVERARPAYLPRGTHWTHWFASTRLFTSWLEGRDQRDNAPVLTDPDSETYRLLSGVVEALRADVEGRGLRFRLLVLPAFWDLVRRVERGHGYWDELAARFRDQGIEVIDLSQALLDAGALEQEGFWMPGHHYAQEGNRIVAQELRAVLEATPGEDSGAGGG